MKTETDNNGCPTVEADLRDAQSEIRRLERVNRELLAACKQAIEAIDEEKQLQAGRGESVAVAIGLASSELYAAIEKAEGKAAGF